MLRKRRRKYGKELAREQQEFEQQHQEGIETSKPVVERLFLSVRSTEDITKKLYYSCQIKGRGKHSQKYVHRERMNLPKNLEFPEGVSRQKVIAAAAQAALLLGTPVSQVAFQYGLPMEHVNMWRDTMITAGAIGRRDRLTDMMMIFIEQEIKSLLAISMITSEERWIREQNAADLAMFIATKTDRVFQLLQAFGKVIDSRQVYANQLEVVEGE